MLLKKMHKSIETSTDNNTTQQNEDILYQAYVVYPKEWGSVFSKCANMGVFHLIQKITNEKGKFYPEPVDLFKAFHCTPLNKVKVVIVGQDPYPGLTASGTPKATGLSFSQRDTESISPSNRNIFKELVRTHSDVGFVHPKNGNLQRWASQGVLLLNRCLTFFPNIKMTRNEKKFWNPFIKVVIDAIISANRNVVFVMWGNDAQELSLFINSNIKTLEWSRPSPLCRRPFVGNNHFVEIDEHLKLHNMVPIDWAL